MPTVFRRFFFFLCPHAVVCVALVFTVSPKPSAESLRLSTSCPLSLINHRWTPVKVQQHLSSPRTGAAEAEDVPLQSLNCDHSVSLYDVFACAISS